MLRYFAVIITSILLLTNCKTENNLKREISNLNKEVFYGIDADTINSSLLKLMINDINTAFNLPLLEQSKAEEEIRIYYRFAYGESFFCQQFLKENMQCNFNICKTVKRMDSLFMKKDINVKLSGKYKYDNFYDSNLLIQDTILSLKPENDNVLDDISQFLLQIKEKQNFKYILIDNPFKNEKTSDAAKYVCSIIRKLNARFSFKFNMSKKNVLDSAFIAVDGATVENVSK